MKLVIGLFAIGLAVSYQYTTTNRYLYLIRAINNTLQTAALFLVCAIIILKLKLRRDKQGKVQLGREPVLACSTGGISNYLRATF